MSSGIKEKKNEFRFYGHNPNQKKWRFSNFSNHSLELDGVTWPTSEHYFQAMKFYTTDIEWFEKIIDCKTPGQAKRMGNSRAHKLRKDWNKVKDRIMYEAVKAKVTQNEDVKLALIATQTKKIIENSKNDYYWGCGGDNSGRNQLGKIFMQIREELRVNIIYEVVFKYKNKVLITEEALDLMRYN